MTWQNVALAVGLTVGLIVGSGACKQGTSETEPAAGPAGRVIEIDGTVLAHGEAGTRELTLDDEVAASDTIETTDRASVRIHLYHNNAEWVLGAGKRRTVRESAAWRAPKSDTAPLLAGKTDPDRTAAAGRQAERTAGDTRATAAAPATAEAEDTRAEEVAQAPEPAAPAPARSRATGKREAVAAKETRSSATETGKPRSPARKKRAAKADRSSALAELDLEAGGAPGGGAAPESAAAEPGKDKAVERRGLLARAARRDAEARPALELGATRLRAGARSSDDQRARVRRALRARLSRLEQCLTEREAEAGDFTVRFAVAGQGEAIGELTVQGGDKAVAACAKQAFAKLAIPGVDGRVQVSQRISWRGP